MAIELRRENKTAVITIDNPLHMNALGAAALNELFKNLMDFENDPDLWVAIITGKGDKAFCSGFEINELLTGSQSAEPHDRQRNPVRELEISKPLIAAVNGPAIGGGLELMLFCDLRVASENAIFGFPEVKLGLIPAWGGTLRLPRQVSFCQAAGLLLTGENIDAQTALTIGLINLVVPPDQVLPSALKLAETINRAAPLAVRAAKEALVKGLQLPQDEGLQIQDGLSLYLKTTADFQEGLRAFREGRQPCFKGN
jgi:enoyl-CoA hydratase/carnithine racemase